MEGINTHIPRTYAIMNSIYWTIGRITIFMTSSSGQGVFWRLPCAYILGCLASIDQTERSLVA